MMLAYVKFIGFVQANYILRIIFKTVISTGCFTDSAFARRTYP